jgi:catechol-2,3-dioxygenase
MVTDAARSDGSPPPAEDALRLSTAIVFVRELARSRDFYRDLLQLEVEIASSEAIMLASTAGDRLVLRARPRAPKLSGGIGIQYLAWTARDANDLERCRKSLQARGALVSTGTEHGINVVEGQDPDGIPVIVVYPPGPPPAMTELPTRIYRY